MTDTAYPKWSPDRESVMDVIARLVLRLAAGQLAYMVIPARRQQGLILTCLIGVGGALAGGSDSVHSHSLQGLSTSRSGPPQSSARPSCCS
jgi:uncharacterized membrane protein YeaQ/YmgE (transglycosylase-associated protein family)